MYIQIGVSLLDDSSVTFPSMGKTLSKQSPTSNMELQRRVDSLIAENKIMVFSKSRCPFCHKAKAALGQFTQNFAVLEVRELSRSKSLLNA